MSLQEHEGVQPRERRPRWPWAVVALVLFVVIVGTVLFLTAREEGSQSVSTTTTTAAPTSTSVSTTTEPTPTTAPPVDASSAVWPYVASPIRYTDPVGAASAFASDFIGFPSPVVGTFRPGDSRSGEVDVRPRAGAPVTTVFVRQLGTDDTWWVLGAATANIKPTEPNALDAISSPVRLRGTSTAFEATVSTEVRQDGSVKPLGRGFVMGGSNGDFGPFDGTLSFAAPTAASGAVMFFTVSMENGQVSEATVVRVRFTP